MDINLQLTVWVSTLTLINQKMKITTDNIYHQNNIYNIFMIRRNKENMAAFALYLYLFCLLVVALIKYIRPVFVSRSDQNSRKKTVEEIKRRAHSGGEWPQVDP